MRAILPLSSITTQALSKAKNLLTGRPWTKARQPPSFALLLVLLLTSPANFALQDAAQPSSQLISQTITAHVPQAELVGKARLKVLFWKVYDASLYAPLGEWQAGASFALNLAYLRDLDGREIAKRSVKEMRDQGFTDEAKLSVWLEQMLAIFPDVKEGDVITGLATQTQSSLFFLNNQAIGEVSDSEFTTHFFNIWLGEKTSEPKMRKQLLGL